MILIKYTFLILGVIISLFLICFMLKNSKKIKRNKKFRFRLIVLLLITISFNISGYFLTEKYLLNKEENKTVEKDDTEIKENINKNLTSNGFEIKLVDGVTYIGGHLIVNKTYPLPSDYIPINTHKTVTPKTTICTDCIVNEAYNAYIDMKNDASKQGLTLWIASGYRSFSYQNALYEGYVNRSGKEAADTFSARSGHSEHQSGYAFDLNSVSDSFATTKEGVWVNANCAKYGFIIRYPKGKEDLTGYKYESWHLRYVGKDLANKLYNGGNWLTMEEYFGITSEYSN